MRDVIPTGVPQNPEYTFGLRPLHAYLRIHARRVPHKPCLIFYGRQITYGELDRSVDRFAGSLLELGVKKGHTVAIFMQNCPQFLIAFFAAQRAGAIPVPLDPMLKEWEVELRVREVDAGVLVANDYLYPVVAGLREKGLLPTALIVTPLEEYLPSPPEIPWDLSFQAEGEAAQALRLCDLLLRPTGVKEAEEQPLDGVGMIMFTSGSSGLPKGAMISNKASVFKAARYSALYQYHEYTVWAQTQGVYHIGGFQMLATALYNGSTVVLFARLSLEATMQAIQRYRCSAWYASTLTYRQILEHPRRDHYNLCSLRRATTVSFGQTLTQEIVDRWSEYTRGGLLVESGYGLTETHTAVAAMPVEAPRLGTYGIPLFGWDSVKIVGEDGQACPVGEPGEILVRNNGVFLGYLDSAAENAGIFVHDWLYTGDIGAQDEEGYLLFFGRKKEMIKSSGFSVFPEEVELYLRRHEAVENAVVIGKPDTRRGEIVKAFVLLKEPYRGKLSEEELLAWSKEKMAPYKRPREVEFIDRLPTTSTGKVLRKEMRGRERDTQA